MLQWNRHRLIHQYSICQYYSSILFIHIHPSSRSQYAQCSRAHTFTDECVLSTSIYGTVKSTSFILWQKFAARPDRRPEAAAMIWLCSTRLQKALKSSKASIPWHQETTRNHRGIWPVCCLSWTWPWDLAFCFQLLWPNPGFAQTLKFSQY